MLLRSTILWLPFSLLVTVATTSFLALVDRHLMAFPLTSARHSYLPFFKLKMKNVYISKYYCVNLCSVWSAYDFKDGADET